MADARRLTLRLAGIAGAALFAFFYALTFHTPEWVEDFAADYLAAQVAEKVDASIDTMGGAAGNDPVSRYAAGLYGFGKEERLAEYKENLKQAARAQLFSYIDQVRTLSAAQRRVLEDRAARDARLTISEIILERSRLVAIVQSGYFAALSDLKRDIRIFTATNVIAFLLLVLVSFVRPEHVVELLVPGMLLYISTLVCVYLYVFGQNWLLTLINGDNMGYAYGSYLAIVFLFLGVIWANRRGHSGPKGLASSSS